MMRSPHDIEWELVRNHASDLLTQDLILGGFYKYCDMTLYGASFKTPFVKYEHSTGNIFWSKVHMDHLRNLTLSPEHTEKLIFDLGRSIEEYKKFIQLFEKELLSGRGSKDLVKDWFDRSQKIIPLVAYFVFEESLAKELLAEGFAPHDVPSARTAVTEASEAIANIKSKFSKEIGYGKAVSATFEAELVGVVKKYGYLGMKYFSGNPWTVSDVYSMVLASEVGRRSEKKVPEHKQSEVLSALASLLKLRTVKWEMMCRSTFLLRSYVIKYFSENFRYEDLLNLTIDEVKRLVDGDYSVLANKRGDFILTVNPDGYSLVLGGQASTNNISGQVIQELSGVTASPGKVVGKAKIILSPKDAYKIEPGDILVATMSTPDFLPAMQRAAAFVTDIGGITSHAAIVSREMKKPCVIGTGNATKVLKDGDLIEVDADKGIVKILK